MWSKCVVVNDRIEARFIPILVNEMQRGKRTSSKLAVRPSGFLKAVLYAVPQILQAGAPLPVVLITLAVGPQIEEWYLKGEEGRRGDAFRIQDSSRQ